MNKYQEALNRIKRSVGNHGWFDKEVTDTLQELVDMHKEILTNEYENSWHNIKIQEHLEKIARNSEQLGFETLGSKNYRTDLDIIRENLFEECETAINEVIWSWIDWSDE